MTAIQYSLETLIVPILVFLVIGALFLGIICFALYLTITGINKDRHRMLVDEDERKRFEIEVRAEQQRQTMQLAHEIELATKSAEKQAPNQSQDPDTELENLVNQINAKRRAQRNGK